jgi:hypothetical protein
MTSPFPTSVSSNVTGGEVDTFLQDEIASIRLSTRYILEIVPPILLLIGTVGNAVSFIVLVRLCRKGTPLYIFFMTLVISDTVVLWNGCFRRWYSAVFDVDIRMIDIHHCRTNLFLIYVFAQFSSWLQVAVTIGRTMAVCCPLHMQTRCTRKKVLGTTLCIFVTLCVLNCHFFFAMEYVSVIGECHPKPHFEYFILYIYSWIDMTIYCIIPLAILLSGTICIHVKVSASQRQSQEARIAHVTEAASQHMRTRSKYTSMTTMLVTLNVVFIVSSTPISVYLIGSDYWDEGASEHELAISSLVFEIASMLAYTNNAINFVLYCISGTRFRLELKALAKCHASPNNCGHTRTVPVTCSSNVL